MRVCACMDACMRVCNGEMNKRVPTVPVCMNECSLCASTGQLDNKVEVLVFCMQVYDAYRVHLYSRPLISLFRTRSGSLTLSLS